jgi:hypothetical protein
MLPLGDAGFDADAIIQMKGGAVGLTRIIV